MELSTTPNPDLWMSLDLNSVYLNGRSRKLVVDCDDPSLVPVGCDAVAAEAVRYIGRAVSARPETDATCSSTTLALLSENATVASGSIALWPWILHGMCPLMREYQGPCKNLSPLSSGQESCKMSKKPGEYNSRYRQQGFGGNFCFHSQCIRDISVPERHFASTVNVENVIKFLRNVLPSFSMYKN
jgi:hypothetical protein